MTTITEPLTPPPPTMAPAARLVPAPNWSAVKAAAAAQWPDNELDVLIDRTVAEITKTVAKRSAAFTWTGDLASMTLAHLAGLAGIHRCALIITDLEFRTYLRWVTDHMPDELTVVRRAELNLGWLADHQHLLFPADGPHALHWHTIAAQRGQEQYYDAKQLGLLLVHYRRHGSYRIGPCRELVWRHRSGVTRYTPLVDWTPEAMWALVHREGLPVAPSYDWARGLGPCPWPARLGTTDVLHGFDEVYDAEPEIVHDAAGRLPQAADYLTATGRA